MSEKRIIWWEKRYLNYYARASCARLRIVDGVITMRMWWYDSIRGEELCKVIRWWMPEVAASRVPIRTRVKIEMDAFKKDLMEQVSHILN